MGTFRFERPRVAALESAADLARAIVATQIEAARWDAVRAVLTQPQARPTKADPIAVYEAEVRKRQASGLTRSAALEAVQREQPALARDYNAARAAKGGK